MTDAGLTLRLPPWKATPDPNFGIAPTLEARSWSGVPLRDADEGNWPLALSRGYVRSLDRFLSLSDSLLMQNVTDPKHFGSPGQRLRVPRTLIVVMDGSLADPADQATMTAVMADLRAQLSGLAARGVYAFIAGRAIDSLGTVWLPASSGQLSAFDPYSFDYVDDVGNPVTLATAYPNFWLQVDPTRWAGGDLLYVHLAKAGPIFNNGFDVAGNSALIGQWAWLRSASYPTYSAPGVIDGIDHDEEVNAAHVTKVKAALDATFNQGIFRRAALKVISVEPTIATYIGSDIHEAQRDLSVATLTDIVTSSGGSMGTPLTASGTDQWAVVQAAVPQIVAWASDFFNL